MKLPRGIRYEAQYRRYRVRKYVDNKAYLGGDWKTLKEAVVALKNLEQRIEGLEHAPRTLWGRATLLRMG